MTQVRLGITRPQADGTLVPVSGVVELRPSMRRETPDDVILPEPIYVPIRPPARPVVNLAPSVGWAWQVTEHVRGKATTRYFLVPDSVEIVDYADLEEVDPLTLSPTTAPEAAWWAALSGLVRKAGPMTREEYDALPVKDPGVLYLLRTSTP